MVVTMFDTEQYCQRYFMRKEAGFYSMGASLLGKFLNRVGGGITKHFGTSNVGKSIGTKLTNWGQRSIASGERSLAKQTEAAVKATENAAEATAKTEAATEAAEKATEGMSLGKKIGLGTLGIGVPLGVGMYLGSRNTTPPPQQQYYQQ